jgi:hypothetical protein
MSDATPNDGDVMINDAGKQPVNAGPKGYRPGAILEGLAEQSTGGRVEVYGVVGCAA